jgi:hypothetical protein
MQNPNFKCSVTGKEFFIAKHSTSFVGADPVYKDQWGKKLINDENGALLIPIPKEGFCINHIANKAESQLKMKDHLKQRAKQHYQTDIKFQKRKRGDMLGDTKHNK